jgi:hypothetical protein
MMPGARRFSDCGDGAVRIHHAAVPPIEGHGTPRPRAALLALAAVLLVGGALRIHHLSYGLPQSYHPDEAVKLIRLRPIVHGDIVLDYLHHPSFMLYSAGAFSRAAALVTGAELDDQHILRYSRLWIALLGTATIAVALRGRATADGDRRAALAAAALLAVTPAAVVLSHHIKEDVPLTLWLLAGLIPLLSLARRGRRRDYLAMGVVLGMAAATKYIGAAMLLVPVIGDARRGLAPDVGRARRTYRHLDLGLLLLVASAVFLAWNFSILLGPQNFTRDFGQEIDHLAPTHSFAELLNFPLSDRDLGPVLLVLAAGALGATFLAAPPTASCSPS